MGVVEATDAEGQPIVGEQFLCRDPQERVFYRGRWYEGLYLHAGATAADVAERKRFDAEIQRWVAWRDGRGRRAFAIPIATASDDAELTGLDRISMTDWLTRHEFSSPRLRWLVDYACRDDYGLAAEQTSAWAGLFYFASRIRAPVPSRGHSSPGRRETAGSSAFRPEASTAAAHRDGGPRHRADRNRRKARRGRHRRGARRWNHLADSAPNRQSLPDRNSWPPISSGHGATIRHRMSRSFNIVPGSWRICFCAAGRRIGGFRFAGTTCCTKARLLGYVVATHQPGPETGPTVLTYYYPFCDPDPGQARRRMLELNWHDCVQIVVADLSCAHPDLQTLIERVDVMRWGHAMIGPRVGFVHGGAGRRCGAVSWNPLRQHRSQRRRAVRRSVLPRHPCRRRNFASPRQHEPNYVVI